MGNYGDDRHGGGDRWQGRGQGYDRDYRGRGGDGERGFIDRAGDEVRSWFGDVAYAAADRRSFLGWGYMLERGATTLDRSPPAILVATADISRR